MLLCTNVMTYSVCIYKNIHLKLIMEAKLLYNLYCMIKTFKPCNAMKVSGETLSMNRQVPSFKFMAFTFEFKY